MPKYNDLKIWFKNPPNLILDVYTSNFAQIFGYFRSKNSLPISILLLRVLVLRTKTKYLLSVD